MRGAALRQSLLACPHRMGRLGSDQRLLPAQHAGVTPSDIERAAISAEDLTDLAVTTRDEHVIKFVEVAQESHRRGNDHALTAGARAAALIPADD